MAWHRKTRGRKYEYDHAGDHYTLTVQKRAPGLYEVTVTRGLGRDLGTLTISADHPSDAAEKAMAQLRATGALRGLGMTPHRRPASRRLTEMGVALLQLPGDLRDRPDVTKLTLVALHERGLIRAPFEDQRYIELTEKGAKLKLLLLRVLGHLTPLTVREKTRRRRGSAPRKKRMNR